MSDVESEETPELSEEKFQDIVTVSTAGSTIEAVFLCDCLEEAGIPAVMQNDSVQGLAGNIGAVRICCPRVHSEDALAVIEKARSQADRTSVEQAFNVQELGFENNPDITVQLQWLVGRIRVDYEGSMEKLGRHVEHWIEEGSGPETITGRLVDAGMLSNDAGSLVDLRIRHYCTANGLPDEMIFLRDHPIDHRTHLLEPHAVGWLAEGTSQKDMARNLSAAGLSMAKRKP